MIQYFEDLTCTVCCWTMYPVLYCTVMYICCGRWLVLCCKVWHGLAGLPVYSAQELLPVAFTSCGAVEYYVEVRIHQLAIVSLQALHTNLSTVAQETLRCFYCSSQRLIHVQPAPALSAPTCVKLNTVLKHQSGMPSMQWTFCDATWLLRRQPTVQPLIFTETETI